MAATGEPIGRETVVLFASMILAVGLVSRYLTYRSELRLFEYGYRKEPVNRLSALLVGGLIAIGFGLGLLADIHFVSESRVTILGLPTVGAGIGALISYFLNRNHGG